MNQPNRLADDGHLIDPDSEAQDSASSLLNGEPLEDDAPLRVWSMVAAWLIVTALAATVIVACRVPS